MVLTGYVKAPTDREYLKEEAIKEIEFEILSDGAGPRKAVMREGKIDVLVGTQMIAKGHNFPKLSLVGVIAADNSLFLDDFRANERTFSLITQVIGRAGRSEGGGIAVVQTYNPDNETIRLSAKQDYEAFYHNEIDVRRALVFPPFCDIAVFSIGADEEAEKKLNLCPAHREIARRAAEESAVLLKKCPV